MVNNPFMIMSSVSSEQDRLDGGWGRGRFSGHPRRWHEALCGYDAWARKGTVAGPEGVNGEGVA